jgi:hypothetical protein
MLKVTLLMKPATEKLLVALDQLIKLFLVNGYAWEGNVSIVSQDPVQFCISLTTPVTLWSGQALQQRRADPVNCFVLKAAAELCSRAGYLVMSLSIKYDDNKEKSFLTIK